jgi:hypothetical protein
MKSNELIKSDELIKVAVRLLNRGVIIQALVQLNIALKNDVFGSVFKKKEFLLHTIRNALAQDNSYDGIETKRIERDINELFISIDFEERNMGELKEAIVKTLESRTTGRPAPPNLIPLQYHWQ